MLFPPTAAYGFRFIPVYIHNRSKREAAVSWSQPELGDAEAINGGHEQLGALHAAAEGTQRAVYHGWLNWLELKSAVVCDGAR